METSNKAENVWCKRHCNSACIHSFIIHSCLKLIYQGLSLTATMWVQEIWWWRKIDIILLFEAYSLPKLIVVGKPEQTTALRTEGGNVSIGGYWVRVVWEGEGTYSGFWSMDVLGEAFLIALRESKWWSRINMDLESDYDTDFYINRSFDTRLWELG